MTLAAVCKLFGLLLFFPFFVGVFWYAYRRSAKDIHQAHASIILEDSPHA
jgi:cbb3-type cytochrome oxidase subunit 3